MGQLQLPQSPFLQNLEPSALTGALAGTDYSNLQATLERNFRDSDLAYQNELLKQQNEQAAAPADMALNNAIREAKTQQANLITQMGKSGEAFKGAQADIQSKVYNAQLDKYKADLSAKEEHFQAFLDMNNEIQSMGGAVNASLQDPQGKRVKEIAQKYDIQGVPDVLKPEDYALIQWKANNAPQTLANIRKQQEDLQKYTYDVGIENAKAGKGRLQLQAESAAALAATRFADTSGQQEKMQSDDQKVRREVITSIQAKGYILPEEAQQYLATAKDVTNAMRKSIKEEAYNFALGDKKAALQESKAMGLKVDEKTPLTTLAEVYSSKKTDLKMDELTANEIKQRFAGTDLKIGDTRIPIREATPDQILRGVTPPTEKGTAETSKSVPTVKNDKEWAALPSGTEFIGPDGVRRRK